MLTAPLTARRASSAALATSRTARVLLRGLAVPLVVAVSQSLAASGAVSADGSFHAQLPRGAAGMATTTAAAAAPLPATMQAVVSGGAKDSKCEVVARPLPALKPREVLVRVAWTALNRADTLQRKGAYPPPPGVTDVLGLEAAGTVAAHGPGCTLAPTAFPVGARVMALLGGGGNAEYVAVHEAHLLPVPGGMPLRTAAAVPETWLTAYGLLFVTGGLKAGESVLVHAAGSGVGTAAVQLAATAGARVVAVAGADSKLELAKSLGAAAGVNYKTTPAWAPAVLAATPGGRGVDLILDPVGASFWRENVGAIAMDGRWVLYGSMGGLHTEGNLLGALLKKRITLAGSTLRSRSDDFKAALVARFAADVLPKLADGSFRPVIDAEFALADIQAGHEYMESNASTGKIVVAVQPEL